MKLQRVSPFRPGFALIATISVLLLLTLVAVAFLSLSALTVRNARIDWAQEEARANARLCLMIAFGELQREMGPDRKISASASILDQNPDTLDIEGVDHPHWLAIFSSEYEGNQNGSPWSRNDEFVGGMQDARGGTAYRAKDAVKGYLVSGNEGGKDRMTGRRLFLDAINAELGNDEDQINLVGSGSVNDLDDHVYVKRIPTEKEKLLPNGTKEYRETGGYGYWIGSHGAKAAVSVADRHRDIESDFKNGKGVQRLINAQDVEAAVIDDIADVVEDEAAKLITLNTMALVHSRNQAGIKNNFHNITGYSRGVLTNTRDGGLKRDLTAYLSGNGTISDLASSDAYYQGLNDDDRLVGPINEKMGQFRGFDWNDSRYKDIAPTFGVLRKWYEFSQSNSFNRKTMDQLAPEVWSNPPGYNIRRNVYDLTNLNTVQFVPFGQPNITPLLTEANLYYNMASFREGSGTTAKYKLRMCLYPRVALWNPYSVALRTPALICQLFVNGGKRAEFISQNKTVAQEIYFGGYNPNARDRQYGGMIFMHLPNVTIPPGETLVFSPTQTQQLAVSPQGATTTDYSRNQLSPTVAPSSDRYFYVDLEPAEFDAPPTEFREVPLGGNANGADNYMVSLKEVNQPYPIDDRKFNRLPLFSYASISLQAGGSDEYPLQWNSTPAVVHQLQSQNDVLQSGLEPDVRTRDGFRLRWWNETQSNIAGSGSLAAHPGHLQSAGLATWNLRGAYCTRTPFDNVAPLPPYFHGIYTRDQPDTEVEFSDMTPNLSGGNNTTFPFTRPSDGPPALIAFELPSVDVGIPSIAYLRHLKLSEFVWHPSYAIGNSLVDPRVPRTGTSPILSGGERQQGGWNASTLGSSYWAELYRNIVYEMCNDNNLIYDQSFEVNFNLWDDFFVSTGTVNQKLRFADDPGANPLPNGRFGIFDSDGDLADDIQDFYRCASRLSMEGAFDVHSTSKQAWKAILSSTRDIGFGSRGLTPYPRLLSKEERDYTGGRPNAATYDGFRSLRVDEIDQLAEAIVYEVKTRAPFFGLADFVNRRLAEDETGRSGAIESAISRAGVNQALIEEYPIDRSRELPDVRITQPSTSMTDATRLRQQDKPESTAWGLPGWLTQGDVLQIIGSTLSARSDSFLIRSYGEAKDINGNIIARAWCEATVQRTPEPMKPDREGLNPERVSGDEVNFGRRFRMVSFRWLGKDEV